jgi:hypothetical protein
MMRIFCSNFGRLLRNRRESDRVSSVVVSVTIVSKNVTLFGGENGPLPSKMLLAWPLLKIGHNLNLC